MAAQNLATATRGFWIISGWFLVWNLMGVMAFVMQTIMSEEALAALPEAQRNLYLDTPAWSTGAFAVAVFGGTLGCLILLMRKSWAVPVLILSLAGIAGPFPAPNHRSTGGFDEWLCEIKEGLECATRGERQARRLPPSSWPPKVKRRSRDPRTTPAA